MVRTIEADEELLAFVAVVDLAPRLHNRHAHAVQSAERDDALLPDPRRRTLEVLDLLLAILNGRPVLSILASILTMRAQLELEDVVGVDFSLELFANFRAQTVARNRRYRDPLELLIKCVKQCFG